MRISEACLALAILSVGAMSGCGADCEPLYEGEATDEVWLTMLDAYDNARVGDPDAVEIVSPTEGGVLAKGMSVMWNSPIARAPGTRDAAPTCHARRARCNRRTGPSTTFGDAIADLLLPSAHAHLPPITGDLYYLELLGTGESCDILVLTTELTWLPDDATWEALSATSETLELIITSAYVDQNRISEGPYRPDAPRSFSAE